MCRCIWPWGGHGYEMCRFGWIGDPKKWWVCFLLGRFVDALQQPHFEFCFACDMVPFEAGATTAVAQAQVLLDIQYININMNTLSEEIEECIPVTWLVWGYDLVYTCCIWWNSKLASRCLTNRITRISITAKVTATTTTENIDTWTSPTATCFLGLGMRGTIGAIMLWSDLEKKSQSYGLMAAVGEKLLKSSAWRIINLYCSFQNQYLICFV